ncbi:MAG: response regulator [Fuerstiella sp.]
MLNSAPAIQTLTRSVFVIDDDELLLKALSHQLNNDGYDVSTFNGGREFLRAFDDLVPGIILMDIRMPQIDGLELQRRLIGRGLNWPVIVMSAFPGTDGTVVAMRQGAFTVLDKPIDVPALQSLMHDAFAELKRRCEQADDLPAELGGHVRYLDRLSERERMIIDRVYAGFTNRAVAEELGLSVKTVEKHRGRAMKKMQVGTFAQLIRLMDRELGFNDGLNDGLDDD